MKKALMFILLYYFCNVNVFSSEEIYSWVGDWKSNQQEIKSLLSNIPFHSEYLDGEIKGLLEFGVMGIANGILTIYTPYV